MDRRTIQITQYNEQNISLAQDVLVILWATEQNRISCRSKTGQFLQSEMAKDGGPWAAVRNKPHRGPGPWPLWHRTPLREVFHLD
jgi:hypothetical protein